VLALASVALYTAAGADAAAYAGGTIAGAGCVVLAVGVAARFALFLPWAVLLAGAGYVLGRESHHVVDGWGAIVGAGLLLAAELAWWAIDDDRRIRVERVVVVRKAAAVAALCGVSALVAFVLVGAAAVSSSAGLGLTAAGVAAAVTAVALVLRLVRA
jgi:hypothetical protein